MNQMEFHLKKINCCEMLETDDFIKKNEKPNLSRYLIFFQFKHGSHDSFLVFFQNLDQRISKQSNELVLREGTC